MQENKSNEELLDLFVSQHFPQDFKFRKFQRHAILSILKFYDQNPTGIYLLDAPTGSGKSIIAFCVAGTLSYKKKRGYLLASDLSLQTQYENDIYRNKLKWGSIKGVDNYICDINFEKHSLGDCKIRNLSQKKIRSLPCYETCGYFSSRDKAMNSNVSLLNYSYWLIQRNYVAPKMDTEPFPIRDFIIADEAHKITGIVQNHFSPRINDKTRLTLEKFRKFMSDEFNVKIPVKSEALKKLTQTIYHEEDKERLQSLLKEFELYLVVFLKIALAVKDDLSKEYEGREIPKFLMKGYRIADWIKDMHCKFEDYNDIIKELGPDAIIKNSSEKQIIFNCIDESFLMKKYFHNQSVFRVLMTATMGDPIKFARQIDINPEDGNVKHMRIPSLFNFEKSPIYVYTGKLMSYRHKEETFPWLLEKIKQVIKRHPNDPGIIHSGSYNLTKNIYSSLSYKEKKRVIIYSNSDEKKEALDEFHDSKNKILMGPSLLEGLDLKNEKSRFQVFAKVPFPSLADKFVKEKMKVSQYWYDWKTIVSILQGVGRSVRSEDDWAITYFLDGSLGNVINRNRSSFPDEFLSRMKFVKTK